ncbi:3-octaprenyl-4-hydroxybenzoate carboxy-lyase [Methanobrevibacter cuticularis]|uniref:3-octaprenyl-4-hydroxybenzoate carboxy-lyase n=1 Tax=Methanobrevibacter cuticularis TaxID=47311 RepID=A0A166E5K5_9EURY|nr:archaeoflavoprotein AfpA [Methanobrevibacter cuticularis]KZX16303.1 3-octaprenyl-4-hydroxybenzoate carboxy-lyase [Methanobrevibacter cuticularis]
MTSNKIAWAISGAGEKIEKTYETMLEIQKKYDDVEIYVYVSQAGKQVLKYYRLIKKLKDNFEKVYFEKNSNAPFLAGDVQMHKFEFLMVAPCTSNTMAKIASRIGDTLITNAVIMGQKSRVPVYIMPVDFKEGVSATKIPNGDELILELTKEDIDCVRKVANMKNTTLFEDTDGIYKTFEEHFPK